MTSAPATAPATTITHRYPWSHEEVAIIAFFALSTPAVTALLWTAGRRPVVLTFVLTALGLAVAAGLYVLGSRRKQASAVSATLTGSSLSVTGGRVKRSRGDLATAVGASTTTMGPETVLVVQLTEGTVLVPGRIVRNATLSAVLGQHLVGDQASLTPGARTLLGV